MSSSSSTKETSLYDKIKLKPTIQNTNINHGLISRGKYGIRTAEGTASYNQNLINISKEGTMQWKDYEKEIDWLKVGGTGLSIGGISFQGGGKKQLPPVSPIVNNNNRRRRPGQ